MGVVRELARLPDLRRVEAAWGPLLAAASSATVGFVVYAFDAGGATAVAVYFGGQALIGAAAGLVVSNLGDRVRRDRLLRLVVGAAMVAASGAAAVAIGGGPSAVVIGLGMLSAALRATFRPVMAASLPWIVRTPEQLTAANVVATSLESIGRLGGPAIAGLLLVVVNVGAAIAFTAGCLVLSSLALVRLRLPDVSVSGGAHGFGWREVHAGARAFYGVVRPGGIWALTALQTFARGMLAVVLAVVALDLLRLGGSSLGWLNAAMGLGGLVGGGLAGALLHSHRLGRSLALGMALWGLPLLLLGLLSYPVVAYAAMLAIGVGNALEDSSVFSLLPRLVKSALAGRVFGVFELSLSAAVGIGSLVAPALVAVLGANGTLDLVGGLLVVVTLAYLPRLRRVDAAAPTPGSEVALLRELPIFGPLPLVIVEELVGALEEETFAPGVDVERQGEPGERFHVIASGTASVSVGGRLRRHLGAGECFGEIALLRNVPRTATVTATEPLVTLTLGRDEFLRGVMSSTASLGAVRSLATERTAGDPAATG